ncbi:MAG: hypothetical protein HWD84_09220 [Flavobacteriaceae bacterium]|nr:hypothetical protein [Flavobacteriaceae bacterium]
MFRLFKTTFTLKPFFLRRRFKKFKLSKEEYVLLKFITSRTSVSSKDVLEKVVCRDDVTYDMQVKYKNDIISKLNLRFQHRYKQNLISISQNSLDRRQVEYSINDMIRVKDY